MKESNSPVTAKYTIYHDIHLEPAFILWLNEVIRTRRRPISRLKATKKYKEVLKVGIQVPNTMTETDQLDLENRNILWKFAIQKELDKLGVAFKFIEEGENTPI